MSKQHQQNAAKAMKQAWVNARQYAEQHGGKPSQYFVFALREAWAEIKQESKTIINATTILGNHVKIDVLKSIVILINNNQTFKYHRVQKVNAKDMDKNTAIKGLVTTLFATTQDNKPARITLDDKSSAIFDKIHELIEEKRKEEFLKQAEQERERKLKTIRVFLSTRGWGDYDNLEWVGTVDTPTDEIIAEAKQKLQTAHDVDNRNLTDADLYQKVQEAKQKWFENQKEKQKIKEIAQKIVDNASEAVKKAFIECKGDPERLHDDIDHPLYWSVWEYVDALSKLD